MLRVATFNINGIRATRRRGFDAWLAGRGLDVLALQELRCPVSQLPPDAFPGWQVQYESGVHDGRNGVALLTRHRPAAVRSWGSPDADRIGDLERWTVDPTTRTLAPFADEGRYIEVDLAEKPLTIASLYLPKGALPAHLQNPSRMREAPDGGVKYRRKMRFLKGFARHLTATRRRAHAAGREFVVLGDFNIAHGELDVANWRRSQQTEGFLPEEREWFSSILGQRRLVDVVRLLHGEQPGPYSWWSWLGRAFENDTGWRIDHHLATPALARQARVCVVDREPRREARLSDHAPVVVDYAC